MTRILFSLFFAVWVFSSAAAEMVKVPLSDCPISLHSSILENASGDCMVENRSRGGSVSLVRYNSKIVVFAHHGDAGTQYYTLGVGKYGVKKKLSEFNYIKKNWSSIIPHEPRTTYFNEKTKVVLYTINLQKERGCVGFVRGMGASAHALTDGSTSGFRKTVSMLVCPNGDSNVSSSALVEVITSATLKGFR